MAERNDQWVCMPCFTMIPKSPGYVTLPKAAPEPVWCPWCGDKMDPANDELLTASELELIEMGAIETHRGSREE